MPRDTSLGHVRGRAFLGAGDAVLWDSRTVHCNTPPLLAGGGEAARAAEARGGEAAEAEAAETAAEAAEAAAAVMGAEEEAGQEIEGRRPGRVVAYASFAPRSRADSRTVVQRQRAFASGQTCTHWPFEMTCLEPPQAVGEPAVDSLSAGAASEQVLRLVGLTDRQLAGATGASFL